VHRAPGLAACSRRSRSARGERVGFHSNPLLTVALPAWRSKLLLFLLFASFVALAGRAIFLMSGASSDFLRRQGEARYARTLEIPATRGRITDRNGVVLASSIPARAVWAIPDDVDASPTQLAELARLLQTSVQELKRRLAAEDRTFVYLRRQVDADVAERIAALKIAGVHSSREFKRHYPEGPTSAHVIGFTNVEDRGQEGVELAHERRLAGRAGSRRVIKDRLGRVVEDDWLREPGDRQPHPVHRAFGAAQCDREAQGEGGRGDRDRRRQRRSARTRELAEFRPECARQARRRCDPKSRADRHLRARLDDETVRNRRGARGGHGAARHTDPDRARPDDDRWADDR
jgi:hypothetical protein